MHDPTRNGIVVRTNFFVTATKNLCDRRFCDAHPPSAAGSNQVPNAVDSSQMPALRT